MGLKGATSLVLCVLAAIAVSDVWAKTISSKTVTKTVTFSSASSADLSSHPDVRGMLAAFGLSAGPNLPGVKHTVSKGSHSGSVSSTRGEFSTRRFTDKDGKNRVRIFYKVYKNGKLISTKNKAFLLTKGNAKEVQKCLKTYKRLIHQKSGKGKETLTFFKGVTLPERRNVVTYKTKLIGGKRVLFLNGKTYEGGKVVYSKSDKVDLTDDMSTADILQLVKHFRSTYHVPAKKSSKKTGHVKKNNASKKQKED